MDPKAMGAAIREARKRVDLTLRDVEGLLAERYGLPTTFVSLGRIERGEQRPRYFILLALAHLYGDVVEQWMGLPETEWPPGLIEKILNREAIQEFITAHVAMNLYLDAIYEKEEK